MDVRAMGQGSPAGPASRIALRTKAAPAYGWPLHVGCIVVFSVSGIAATWWWLGPLTVGDLGGLAGTLLFINLGEYLAHRGPLHRAGFPRAVYERHVVEHHAFFTYEHMVIDAWRDIQWVLFPPWALPLLVVSVAPWAWGLGVVVGARAAGVFVLAILVYYALYEVLHAIAHLPPTWAIARPRLVQAFVHHHRVHHDPRLMRRWNFNFAIPLCDVLFGTRYGGTVGQPGDVVSPPSVPSSSSSRGSRSETMPR